MQKLTCFRGESFETYTNYTCHCVHANFTQFCAFIILGVIQNLVRTLLSRRRLTTVLLSTLACLMITGDITDNGCVIPVYMEIRSHVTCCGANVLLYVTVLCDGDLQVHFIKSFTFLLYFFSIPKYTTDCLIVSLIANLLFIHPVQREKSTHIN